MALLRVLRKPGWRGSILGALTAFAAWWATHSSVLGGLEAWLQDGCFSWRGQRGSREVGKIILVSVDDAETADVLNKPLAFVSPALAKAVNYLAAQKAAAVGIDVFLPDRYFGLKEFDEGATGDAFALGKARERAGNVVIPEIAETDSGYVQRFELPIMSWLLPDGEAVERQKHLLGFLNLTEDKDYFLRSQQLCLADPDGGGVHCHFALALASVARGLTIQRTGDGLMLGPERVPLDDEGKLRINYVGPAGTFQRLSLKQLLDAAEKGAEPPLDLKQAIVIIGTMGRNQQDHHATPYSNNYWRGASGSSAELMAGVEVHANILATLLDRAYIVAPAWPIQLLVVVIAGVFLGRAYARMHLAAGLLVAVAHHFGWKFVCVLAFTQVGMRVEILPMLLLGGTLYGLTFLMRWWTLRRMVGMVNSEAVARLLDYDPGKLDRHGEDRIVSVLFADIRSFSTFSERHSARDVVALLNAYFTAVVPVIERHGGTLNQYIGDGMMVIFGSPVVQEDHALRAVRAAVELVKTVHELTPLWRQLDFPEFAVGVGVNSGRAVLGMVGSPTRLDYTAIGDTTNTAARIQAHTRTLETEILISRQTYLEVPRALHAELRLDETVHTIEVKGKSRTVDVHVVRPTS